MKTKICTKCGIEKLLNEFYNNKKGRLNKSAHCKICDKLLSTKYYIQNKNKVKQKNKDYKESHLEYYSEYNKNYQQNPEYKLKRNKKEKYRYYNDTNYKILKILRNRIWDVLNRSPKNKKTLELIGCSLEELKIHLKKQFIEGMNWNNHGKGIGKWNIDHILPCDSFDLTDPKQQEICFNYKNLQPLWSLDNIKKSNKLYSRK